jgi:hypothetical protein
LLSFEKRGGDFEGSIQFPRKLEKIKGRENYVKLVKLLLFRRSFFLFQNPQIW